MSKEDVEMRDPAEEDGGEEEEDYDQEEAQLGEDEALEEIQLQNDSVAHFDAHKDSIFCIASHPIHSGIVATGGGDDVGYIFDATPAPPPVLPSSYESDPQPVERESIKPIFKLDGHSDSVNAIAFTLPKGEYVVSAGLDGKLRAWQGDASAHQWSYVAEASEVEEINWLSPCPHPDYPNTIALGASDGSVWVYTINAQDKASPLTIVQVFYSHTAACTGGAWTPDGKFLATISEDASFYVWDVFGEAAASGLASAQGGQQSVVGLTGQDDRFRVEGGLYSVAVAPNGAFAAVGGTEGQIRIVGLPILGATNSTAGAKGAGAKSKPGGGRQAGGSSNASSSTSGQVGQLLASLQAGSDSVETLSFSQAPLTLLAAGNVDGSITLFDHAHRFAVRRRIESAHEDEEGNQAVVKVEFASNPGQGAWLLTSCGNDGVLRRWDARGGTAAAGKGLIGEFRGHRGGVGVEDEAGGGILGFVQGDGGKWVATAGDE
jgi:ribosome assembly protein SQT1